MVPSTEQKPEDEDSKFLHKSVTSLPTKRQQPPIHRHEKEKSYELNIYVTELTGGLFIFTIRHLGSRLINQSLNYSQASNVFGHLRKCCDASKQCKRIHFADKDKTARGP